jgi:hypothetical protein
VTRRSMRPGQDRRRSIGRLPWWCVMAIKCRGRRPPAPARWRVVAPRVDDEPVGPKRMSGNGSLRRSRRREADRHPYERAPGGDQAVGDYDVSCGGVRNIRTVPDTAVCVAIPYHVGNEPIWRLTAWFTRRDGWRWGCSLPSDAIDGGPCAVWWLTCSCAFGRPT